jgi:putative ABC transport system permease protein
MEFYKVLAALALVGIALLISWYEKVKLEKDIIIGTFRSFVQLIAIGYALEIVFNLNKLYLVFLVILIMILVGGYTASGRNKESKGGLAISIFSIALGTFITIGSMVLLGIISSAPKYLIPLSGMIIGNSMNAASLALERMHSEIKNKKSEIETALALGATSKQAIENSFKITIKAAMLPTLNLMKVIGLVQLPGAMTGMIIAGAKPKDAVLLQIVVAYMLISGVTITSVVCTKLSLKRYFTKYHQLIEGIV